ncbi:hypothetical protein [Nonomuraea sp. KM88]|uniref:hypothetical protein n=1 Tax=Nonomuraea sp. KM88 TaxID=3457427 RepID=UPI003FCDC790
MTTSPSSLRPASPTSPRSKTSPGCVDVLRDRIVPLGIPVLGGLELGHGPDPRAVPLGTVADLDTGSGTLTVRPPAR